jgi:hypothetical protein
MPEAEASAMWQQHRPEDSNIPTLSFLHWSREKEFSRRRRREYVAHCQATNVMWCGVVCCLKARLSEAEQTSIASQRFNNVHIRGNE